MRRGGVVGLLVLGMLGGCVQADTAPETPAAIEFAPFPWPSVVLGDVMRNEAGDSVPLRAIVRNVTGGELSTADVRFLIPDSVSRLRVRVDSLRGFVRGDSLTTQPVRVIARTSASLQAVSPTQGRPDGGLVVTLRPDTLLRSGTRLADTVLAAISDTLPPDLRVNISQNLTVNLANLTGTQRTAVQRWIVRFAVVSPANPTNDSTQRYYLVDRESSTRRASTVDTTDGSGEAGRALRARGSQLTALPETVTVEARATYRGQPVRGTPVRFRVLIRRP